MTNPSADFTTIDEFELDYKPKYQVFHDLMVKRINKVLLVSSYYDNFILEEDGRLSDQIFAEFHNITNYKYVTQWGGSGKDDRQLLLPRDLDFSQDEQKLYAIDRDENRLQAFYKIGTFLK